MSSGPSAHLRGLAIVYVALMLGMVIFAAIVTFLAATGEAPVPEVEEGEGGDLMSILPLVAGVLTVTTVFPAVLLGRMLTMKMAGAPGLGHAERTQRYVSAKILLAAVVEGPGLLWGVTALLSGDILHLAGLAFSVFGLALLFPRADEWAAVNGADGDGAEPS